MSRQHFNISKGLTLTPVTAQPADPQNGDVIYNSTSNRFEKYQNGSWGALDSVDGAFHVWQNSGQGIPDSAFTTLIHNQTVSDPDNLHNSSTGEFKLKYNGIGQLNVNALLDTFAAPGVTFLAVVYKNGSQYKMVDFYVQTFAGGFTQTIARGSCEIEGTTTDVFTLQVLQNSGVARGMYTGGDAQQYNWMSMTQLQKA